MSARAALESVLRLQSLESLRRMRKYKYKRQAEALFASATNFPPLRNCYKHNPCTFASLHFSDSVFQDRGCKFNCKHYVSVFPVDLQLIQTYLGLSGDSRLHYCSPRSIMAL